MSTDIPIELRKIAYRQSAKDGLVITFAVHPNDMPSGLASAPIGTRFMAALVEIGDDEKPIGKAREKQSWHDMSLAQQAGILCGDPVFAKFLDETVGPNDPAKTIRSLCGVGSRSDIKPGTEAARRWTLIVSDFRAWQHEPEVVPP